MYQGVVLLNKEAGFTSFDAVAVCRRIFGQKAVGHTGTLDPMATGVLPICLGRATKLTDLLTSSEKEYEVEMELGVSTDTDDRTGEILCKKDIGHLTEEMVEEALLRYVGDYDQVPPRYAAIKKDGKKLYEYARAGIQVDMPGRPVSIYEIEILEMKLPVVRFRVRCSKGTYIRSLCRDVGEDLGTGAVMSGLLRRSTGGFSLEQTVTLGQLEKAKEEGVLGDYVLPMDRLLLNYLPLQCTEEGRKALINGNALKPSMVRQGAERHVTEQEGSLRSGDQRLSLQHDMLYRVYLDGQLAALYRFQKDRGILKNEKMLLERG